MKLAYEDIDSIALDLHDFLVDKLGCTLDENDDFGDLVEFLHDKLRDFSINDYRNYN